jgi:PAS domain S-box-containing protein
MSIEKNPDEISTIRDLLAEHSEGLPIKSISEMLGMNRNSVAKYLDMLQMTGRVTLKRIGTAKIYCIANKLPASAVLKLTKSHVIIFNQMLTVADINDSFTTLLKIAKKEILGKTLDHLPFAVQSQPALLTLIKEGIRGTESKTSASIKIGNRDIPCTLTISPTFFENGQNCVSLIIDFIHEPVNGKITDNDKCDLPSGFEGIEYICRFTVDGTLTYVNRAYSDLLQKTHVDLIGQNWRPPIPDVEFKKIKSCLLSLDSVNPVALEEFKVITPGGDSQWQRWKFRILFDQNGNPEGYQGNGFDITEIKKLEQKVSRITDEIESLKQQRDDEVQDLNKQLYHEIASHEKTNFQLKFTQFAMDNASYMITWIGENGRFVYMNNQAQRMLGYHYRDVISKSFKDIFEGVFPLPWDEIWEVIKQEQQYSFETVLTTSKGIEIPADMVLNYLEFKGKQYCCCFAKDITERKRAEETLRDNEARLRLSVQSVNIGLWDWDLKNNTVHFSPEWKSQLGYRDDEISNSFNEWEKRVHPDDVTLALQKVNNFLANPQSRHEIEVRMQHKDGSYRWITALADVLRDADGTPVRMLGCHIDITERKMAEEAIKQSEIRYHSLFEKMLEGYSYCKILFDQNIPKDFVYIEVNSAFETLTGLKNVAGRKVSEVIPGIHDSNPELLRKYSRVALTGRTEQFETYLPLLELYLSITVYSQQKGYFIAMFENITERKRAEIALRESQELFATTFYSGPLMLTISDINTGRYLDINDAFTSVSGFSRDETIGKTSIELGWITPEDRESLLLDLKTKGKVTGKEIRLKKKNGESVWCLFFGKIIIVSGKEQFLSLAEDITERKNIETALEMHGEIVQNLAEGVVLISASDGKIVYANPRFESMFGYDENELIGRPISEVNAPGDKNPQTTADEIINNLEINGTWSGEVFNIRKDGTTFWCHATVSTFDHPQYGPVWVSVHLDITKRKRAEEALRVANKKLNLFSTVTRHDINNQMTIMRVFINRLERELPEGSFTEYFHKINASGDQISALIQLTKSYENIGVNTTDWQDIRTLVEAATKDVELGPVRLENEIPDGIELFADPLITKVFYNLLENAIRHGKTLTKIQFTAKEYDGNLIIFCEDDGVGVVAEDKERIFKRGYSKDTRMSLFVAHEILDITDISIRETGEPGKGSRFEIIVPNGMHRNQSLGVPV